MAGLRFRYQTIEFGDEDIHLRTLRDRQQFQDKDGAAEKLGISSASWPLFGIVWPSGQVLAQYMSDYDTNGLRILEVGCGIGLTSLRLNQRQCDITATDHHPEAESFLQENTNLNGESPIPFERTDWADLDSKMGLFDLVIGSDLLYEREHVNLLSHFIERHAKPHCVVILVDPGRGHHARFSKKMVSQGYSHHQHSPKNTEYLNEPFKGKILTYRR